MWNNSSLPFFTAIVAPAVIGNLAAAFTGGRFSPNFIEGCVFLLAMLDAVEDAVVFVVFLLLVIFGIFHDTIADDIVAEVLLVDLDWDSHVTAFADANESATLGGGRGC